MPKCSASLEPQAGVDRVPIPVGAADAEVVEAAEGVAAVAEEGVNG